MKTNLEKWNYYLDDLNRRADEYMDTINPLKPIKFWKVNLNGSINECFIQNRNYHFRLYFNGKNPTNKDIKKIKNVFESEIVFESEKAYFDYKYCWGIFKGKESYSSTSIKVNDLFSSDNAFLTLHKAESKAKDIVILNEAKERFQDKFKKDKNYNYTENGYKFLGWQNGWEHAYYDEDGNLCSESWKPKKSFGYKTEDYPLFGKCRDLRHQKIEVSHNQRGSENTVSCPICKIYWKYDCSD